MNLIDAEELARILDAQDVMASMRAKFDIPADVTYFDGNSLGPLTLRSREVLHHTIEVEWREPGRAVEKSDEPNRSSRNQRPPPPLTRRCDPPRPQSWHGSRRPVRNIAPHLDDLIWAEFTLNVPLFRPLKSNSYQREIGL